MKSMGRESRPRLAAFAATFGADRPPLVGSDGIPVVEFLRMPVLDWARA